MEGSVYAPTPARSSAQGAAPGAAALPRGAEDASRALRSAGLQRAAALQGLGALRCLLGASQPVPLSESLWGFTARTSALGQSTFSHLTGEPEPPQEM